MAFLIVLTAVLLTVVIFTLQNGQAVTIRFFFWEVEASLAVVTAAAMAAGVAVAALVGLANRLWRWNRGRSAVPTSRVATIGDRTSGWRDVESGRTDQASAAHRRGVIGPWSRLRDGVQQRIARR